MKPSNNLENKTPSDTYWRVQSVCKNVQAHISLESQQNTFDKSGFIMTFLTILGVIEILCSFRLVLEAKTGKETPDRQCETTWIDFWTWICSTRQGGLGQEVAWKLSWCCLTSLITMVLLIRKWMDLSLRKNHLLLRCWGWPFLLNWIGALTLSL